MQLAPKLADARRSSPLRVLIVDDSVVVRRLVAQWISEEPGAVVAGSARTGREALDQIEATNPDVVVLDIRMPVLDGLETLPALFAMRPDLVVIVVSALTRAQAEATLEALRRGATDCVAKPTAGSGGPAANQFRRELMDKIQTLGLARRKTLDQQRAAPPPPSVSAKAEVRQLGTARQTAAFESRVNLEAPAVLAIGASTGGPKALTRVLADLGSAADHLPILLVQHLPASFTPVLADHLTRACGRRVHVPRNGEMIRPGRVYLAPGDAHMCVEGEQDAVRIVLDPAPPVNYCRPSLDPLLSSTGRVYGKRALAVVLTGMGHDGLAGAAEMVAAGGRLLAQDEATSVIWGMPGAVANAGLCTAVLPLDGLGAKIKELCCETRP